MSACAHVWVCRSWHRQLLSAPPCPLLPSCTTANRPRGGALVSKSFFKGKRVTDLRSGPQFFFFFFLLWGPVLVWLCKILGRQEFGPHTAVHTPPIPQGSDQAAEPSPSSSMAADVVASVALGVGQPHQARGHLLHWELPDSPGSPRHHHRLALTGLCAIWHLLRASS